jgi:hypothetical protein
VEARAHQHVDLQVTHARDRIARTGTVRDRASMAALISSATPRSDRTHHE